MVKNPAYWDAKRRPKIDRVVLLPLPEANSRTAALMSGQVDWIEAPAPDALDAIKQRGFKLSNLQPHIWPWQFSFVPGSPWLDKRVRQAANLCVNRTAMKQLLGGMMVRPPASWSPATRGAASPVPDQVRRARRPGPDEQAGYGRQALKVKVQTSASGSGQMQPLPMNEFMQQNLKSASSTWTSTWSSGTRCSPTGASAPRTQRARRQRHQRDRRHHGPVLRHGALRQHQGLPAGVQQLGLLQQPEGGCRGRQGAHHLRRQERDAALAELHTKIVDEAPFLFVAHDVGPRAMSAKVGNVVQPQSWFIDIATMTMK
jgi:ABC-type transport system substrate-binding protein